MQHTQNGRRLMRPVMIAAGLLAVAAVASIAWLEAPVHASPKPAAGPPPAAPVSVASALERPVTEFDEFSGRLEAIEKVEVRPRVSGYIESIHFAPGAMVKRGATLFVIDPKPYQAEVERAEAALASAEARLALADSELARARRLLDDHAVAQRELEERVNAQRDAQATIRSSKAALDIARLNLGYTRITAPIDGRISRAEVTVGNLVAAGAGGPALTSIVSTSPMYATFEVDERAFLKYAAHPQRQGGKALPVALGLASEDGYPRKGAIEFVDNRLDPQSGTIRVRALFDNTDGVLTPGMFARVKLGSGAAKPAVLIDDRAIGTDQSRKFVFVVGTENKVAYREVKLGPLVDGLRVVREGLNPGERIVVNGLQRVRPGVLVAPNEVPMNDRTGVAQRAGGTPAAQSMVSKNAS
jgi:multidrug efflux system membrane fusion protein